MTNMVRKYNTKVFFAMRLLLTEVDIFIYFKDNSQQTTDNGQRTIVNGERGMFKVESTIFDKLTYFLCCSQKKCFCCSISCLSSSSVGRNVRYFAWNSRSLSFSIEYRAISLLV